MTKQPVETDAARRGLLLKRGREGAVRNRHPWLFTGAIERETGPDCLEITAWTEDGEIMGVRHKTLAIEGVQFHPESILTEHGHDLLNNFLKAY